jgi:TPR repeat protein
MRSEAIFSRFAGRVLFLTCDLSADDETLASGVLVSADGFFVTNAHVVEGCRSLTATYISGASRRPYEATLKYYDKKSDTAVLKIEGRGFDFFNLVARNVHVGERVYTIGNPRGLEQSMSEGIVSGLRSEDGTSWIQHSAPISPGSSGGALISSRGELLGINSWYGKESQNLNFAVPASTLVTAFAGARALRESLRFPGLPPVSQADAPPRAEPPPDLPLPSHPSPSEQGDPIAQYKAGEAYFLGQDVPKDYSTAAKWFRNAADQGYAPAQVMLGSMLENGAGVPQDDAEAAKWYRKAADQGQPLAQYDISAMFRSGRGVAQNDPEAARWLRKAADQGLAGAQYGLGVMLNDGEGVQQNDAEAAKWFRKAADQGHDLAQYNLGLKYHKGQGVPQDDAEAAKWLRKSADQGYAPAQYNLGLMYDKGQGLSQDYAEAVKWFRKAGDQGLALAQYNLGQMLYNGQRASRHQIARTFDDRIRPSRVNTGMPYKCAVAAMIRSGRSGTSSRGMAAMFVAMS